LQNLQNDLHNWRRWLCKQAANRHAKFAKWSTQFRENGLKNNRPINFQNLQYDLPNWWKWLADNRRIDLQNLQTDQLNYVKMACKQLEKLAKWSTQLCENGSQTSGQLICKTCKMI
jgi:hypothetical protein